MQSQKLISYVSSYASPLIGNFIRVYGYAHFAYDSVIHDYAIIAAYPTAGDRVVIDQGANIEISACIREDAKVGKYAVVGLDSFVLKDVKDFEVVAEIPQNLSTALTNIYQETIPNSKLKLSFK